MLIYWRVIDTLQMDVVDIIPLYWMSKRIMKRIMLMLMMILMMTVMIVMMIMLMRRIMITMWMETVTNYFPILGAKDDLLGYYIYILYNVLCFF